MPIHKKNLRFPFGGLEFFQCSSNETLQERLEREIKRIANLDNCSYIFYSMTCYISQSAVSNIASLLNAELGERLSGFNILFDQDEFIKQENQISTITRLVLDKTVLPENSINILPVSTKNGLFHAKAYALLLKDFEASYFNKVTRREDYPSNSYSRQYHESSDKPFLENKIRNKSNQDSLRFNNPPCLSHSNRMRQGFLVLSSGNFTGGGLRRNFEVGYTAYSSTTLNTFFGKFKELQDNVDLDFFKDQVESHRNSTESENNKINLLQMGTFYHKWLKKIDLRFRLDLSNEEVKRIRSIQEQENKERYRGFDRENAESLSIDPIEIRNFFDRYPKPISDNFWAYYSIETILGNWVPGSIAKIIEEDVNKAVNFYLQKMEEEYSIEHIDTYAERLQSDVDEFKSQGIISSSNDNDNAILFWQTKAKSILNSSELLKTLICKYEPIKINLNSQDSSFGSSIYERTREMNQHLRSAKGVTRIFLDMTDELTPEAFEVVNRSFQDLAVKAREYLKKSRTQDLEEISQGEEFVAIFESPGNDGKNLVIIEGYYISNTVEITSSQHRKLLYQPLDSGKQGLTTLKKQVVYKINDLWAFKKIFD